MKMKAMSNPIGIGNDLIEIQRIRHTVEAFHMRFLNRVFTRSECAYCLQFKDPVPRLAARFAGKEAVAKALGTGIGTQVSWHDIEILNDAQGKPVVHLSNNVERAMPHVRVLLSLSHCHTYASAVALCLYRP